MQLLGCLLGLAAAVVLYPGSRRLAEDLAAAGDRERTADLDTTDCDIVGKRLEDWQLEDPNGKDLETVRRIVDNIDARVLNLLDELGVPSNSRRARHPTRPGGQEWSSSCHCHPHSGRGGSCAATRRRGSSRLPPARFKASTLGAQPSPARRQTGSKLCL